MSAEVILSVLLRESRFASSITDNASEDIRGASGTSDSGDGSSRSASNNNSGLHAVKSKLHPKTKELLANRRTDGGVFLQSYHELLGILEVQGVFDDAGIR